jgi:hypothetical protein
MPPHPAAAHGRRAAPGSTRAGGRRRRPPAAAPQAPQAEYTQQYGEQYDPASFTAPEPPAKMGDAARKALERATRAIKRYGWFSFWVQLSLSVVSGVILLFSVAFTSQVGARQARRAPPPPRRPDHRP